MEIGGTLIDDTFAEAFRMHYVRLVVTAIDEHWLDAAVREFCGYSTSVIACDAEIGSNGRSTPRKRPTAGRARRSMAFGFSPAALAAAVPNRVGQCLMTCPTTAVYDGLRTRSGKIPLGKHIRFFGDGYQKSKVVAGRRYWRIPVMDGEFLVQDQLYVDKGVGGGNIILQSATQAPALAAARRAVEAIGPLAGVITPFPGGWPAAAAKWARTTRSCKASTADAYCPTLRGRVETKLFDGVTITPTKS